MVLNTVPRHVGTTSGAPSPTPSGRASEAPRRSRIADGFTRESAAADHTGILWSGQALPVSSGPRRRNVSCLVPPQGNEEPGCTGLPTSESDTISATARARARSHTERYAFDSKIGMPSLESMFARGMIPLPNKPGHLAHRHRQGETAGARPGRARGSELQCVGVSGG